MESAQQTQTRDQSEILAGLMRDLQNRLEAATIQVGALQSEREQRMMLEEQARTFAKREAELAAQVKVLRLAVEILAAGVLALAIAGALLW